MDGNFEQARDFFLQGVGHYEAARFEQADRAFSASLALVPGRPSTLANLGATRLKLGRFEDAVQLLEEALAQQPDDAEALGHYGAALAELGHPTRALAAFDRSVALAPQLGAAWLMRGSVLRELGRRDEAAASFERALASGADAELARYYLASLRGDAAPEAPPRHYVEALFDGYAADFDQHLQALNYHAPEVLVRGLAGHRFARVLDLGCGTGLCGRLLRPQAEAIEGVDLSQAMVARAHETGVYTALAHADLVAHLADAAPGFDLVIAADVFIYVGALAPVFAGVARVLQPGGRFCFSVEEALAQPLELRDSLRYAHSEASIRALAAAHGMQVEAVQRGTIREDQRAPIAGLYVWLMKD